MRKDEANAPCATDSPPWAASFNPASKYTLPELRPRSRTAKEAVANRTRSAHQPGNKFRTGQFVAPATPAVCAPENHSPDSGTKSSNAGSRQSKRTPPNLKNTTPRPPVDNRRQRGSDQWGASRPQPGDRPLAREAQSPGWSVSSRSTATKNGGERTLGCAVWA